MLSEVWGHEGSAPPRGQCAAGPHEAGEGNQALGLGNTGYLGRDPARLYSYRAVMRYSRAGVAGRIVTQAPPPDLPYRPR